MADGELTRRAMLGRGVAAAAAGVAGCSTLLGTDEETGVFTQWLPAPAGLGTDHYQFRYADLGTLATERDHLGGEPDVFESAWRPVGLAWEDASAVVGAGSVDVITADYDRADVVADLRDAGYADGGDYRGYTLYANEADATAFAVGDATLLTASESQFVAGGSPDPVTRMEAVLDANQGDAERYPEANADMRALVEALGTGTLVQGKTMATARPGEARSGRFANLVASGFTRVVDGATVDETHVYVYEDQRDVDRAVLKSHVEASENATGGADALAAVEDVSYETDGRLGSITGTRPADTLYSG